MTLKEAIEIISKAIPDPDSVSALDLIAAEQLGVEALKRCKAYKEAHVGLHYEPLPGETKE